MPRILEWIPASKILVIDDDSSDGTGDWCDTFKKQDSRLEVLHRVGERGLGSATLAGFRRGLENGFDLIATMDADLSHDPKSLKAMLEMLENDQANRLGLVIGSRYVEGGGIREFSLSSSFCMWYCLPSSCCLKTAWFTRIRACRETGSLLTSISKR